MIIMKKFNIRKLTAGLLSAVMLLSCILSAEAFAKEDDKAIIDGIVGHFMPLTEIPRQSHHEEKVSEYLFNWAKDKGFNPAKDAQNNVIFDVPASEGMENKPLAILQGHMDMVIAVADGKTFDPQKDGIKVINDGEKLTADGTSLGADDGIGIATALYLIENNKAHGPLRVIFTTNEEDGMTGAMNLDAKVTDAAKYVINLDYEYSNEACNSAAAGNTTNVSGIPEIRPAGKTLAMQLVIKGLLSGHSGIDINKGRLNGIKAMGQILKGIEDEKVDFELASFIGGSALNAIPAKASACIVIDPKDEETVRASVEKTTETLKKQYGEVEKDAQINVNKCETPANVLTDQAKNDVLKFVNGIFDGVNTMSDKVEGLVESSSNYGIISVIADDKKESTGGAYIRSSDATRLDELTEAQVKLAKDCNFEMTYKKTSDAWPVNPDSKIVALAKGAYKAETGDDLKVVQVHAGIECGTFAKLNPELDIIALGFDIKDPHTIKETLTLTTIPTTYRVIESVLANLE